MYSWDNRFKNSFQIAKYLTCTGCKRVASKPFSTIRKSTLQACYCFRFNYYHSVRVNTRAIVISKVVIFLFVFLHANKSFAQANNTKCDTIKVQLLLSTIDSSENNFMQIPVFARNGYIVVKNKIVIRYLDWYKQPLSSDEIVWDFKRLKGK